MQTEFIKLAVIFIVIMVMVLAKLKLRDAMIVAILLTVILFGIPLGDAAKYSRFMKRIRCWWSEALFL